VTPLSAALEGENVAIIAEIKRSSPSKGSINPEIDSGVQARLYEAGGASAISVLTEPEKFGGSDDDIARVNASSSLPVLKKDFHVSEIQIVHAASLGVAAALVIVRAVSPRQLEMLAQAAKDNSLELDFEVRDEIELERALDLDARVIGVNNRNLETLEVDPFTVERIVPLIPRDRIAIAESGYSSVESIASAARAGADAVLIGSHVSASADPAGAIREIASIPKSRSGRGR
jgi:indole-3-glycerol phosphate synthase